MPGRSRPMAESANQRLISILRSRSCVSVSTLDDLPEEPVPVAYRAERLEIGVEADERAQEEDTVSGSAEDAMRERDLRHLRTPREEVVVARIEAQVALERLARDVHDLHHRARIVVRADEAERRAGGGDPGVVVGEQAAEALEIRRLVQVVQLLAEPRLELRGDLAGVDVLAREVARHGGEDPQERLHVLEILLHGGGDAGILHLDRDPLPARELRTV